MKITKNKLTSIIALVTVLCMMVGAFAYFTDRVDTSASVSTADVSKIIDVDTDPDNPNSPEDPQAALEAVWEKNNPDEIVHPGDSVDLSYKLENEGSSDIDVMETIILTSKVPLNQTSPEWRLYSAVEADPDGYGGTVGVTVVAVEKISQYQVKYTLAPFTLAKGAVQQMNYTLVFDKYAGNAFQGDVCTIDYLVEMRQHVDTIKLNEGWDVVRTDSITFAGISATKVVPAA